MSANSVAFPIASSPSPMTYYVILLLLMFMMYYKVNHTYGSDMLCMSPVLALLLLRWEIIYTGYQRYHPLPLSLWLLQNREVCFLDDLPSRQEEDHSHNLQTRPLRMTTKNGQGHGGVLGHIHVTHWGASPLSGQAPHRSDPRCPMERSITIIF